MAREKKEKIRSKIVVEPIPLATEPTKICRDVYKYIWLIYGAHKIGKTTLLANAPGAYFIATDPGLKFKEVMASRPMIG